MLEVRSLSVSYGQHRALEDVSIRVDKGEVAVILGANGAGKSTLLRTISGICEGTYSGDVEMDGHPILGLAPDRVVEHGVALVPEGRGIFGDLTVRENLMLGAYSKRARGDEHGNLERIMSLFPKLGERQNQVARTMSGGEQQMVAIGRAMMSNPQVLMLDEPSLGLSPLLCKELFHSLTEVRRAGIGILLVEQNAKQSLAIADRGYLLENAHIVHEDSAARLADDPAVQKAYLGAGGSATAKPLKGAPTAAQPAEPPDEEKRYTDVGAARTLPATAAAPPRRSADQLLGQSIDDLVAAAATQSSAQSRAGPAAATPVTLRTDDHQARLQAVLKSIEVSAASARTGLQRTRIEHKAGPASGGQTPPKKPVVIEVYRPPRVEVYRRRSGSTKFERD